MSASNSIRLTLARSGGVAGVRPPPTVLDTAKLSESEAARIYELLDAADFFSLPTELPERKPHPDGFQYSLTVKSGGTEHTVTFTAQSAGEPLRELKHLVREHAKR